MHPGIRNQKDNDQNLYSAATGIEFFGPEGRSVTRQEHKDEADINSLLKRYGVGVPQRPPVWGEVDFDLDLQTAHKAITTAKEVHAGLPADLKAKYPNWQSLLNGLENGQLKIDLDNTPKPDNNTATPSTEPTTNV